MRKIWSDEDRGVGAAAIRRMAELDRWLGDYQEDSLPASIHGLLTHVVDEVSLTTGEVHEIIVDDLRVRNYTLIETSTPDPNAEGIETIQVTPTFLSEYQAVSVSPTPLPTNPVQITVQDLQKGAFQGVAVVIIALAAGGFYVGIRFLYRRL
jgi:hypothetical protein